MEAVDLKVGQKVEHVNGICMYAGSKPAKFWDEAEIEDYAVFVFKNPKERIYIPHRSLHLIKDVDQSSRLTNMRMPIEQEIMTDEEIIELFLK